MKSKNIYHLPLAREDVQAIVSDLITHKKGVTEEGYTYDLTQAIDFKCPEGSSVLASLEGKVVVIEDRIPRTKNWNSLETPSRKVMREDEEDGNYIILEHANREYSMYSHMLPGEMKVKVGDYVQTGQAIGKSGNTGQSTEPHLHYVVRIFTQPKPRIDFESLEPNWAPEDSKWIKNKIRKKNAA